MNLKSKNFVIIAILLKLINECYTQSRKCKSLNTSEFNKKCDLNWLPRYYYKHDEQITWKKCTFFWYGGCSSIDKNLIFEREHDCYARCGENSNIFLFFNFSIISV